MKTTAGLNTSIPYAIHLSRGVGAKLERYEIALVGKPAGHVVNYAHGRGGSKLTVRTATPSPVSLAEAERIYHDLTGARIAEGYSADIARAERIRVAPRKTPPGAHSPQQFLIGSGRSKKMNRGVQEAKIAFVREGDLWLVGLAITSKNHGDDKVQMIVHLRDFPVHGIDVRREPFRIRIDNGYDFAEALGREWMTNLYYYEHTETKDSRIEISPASKGHYHVKWSAKGTSMSDRFEIDCVAARMKKTPYP